MRQSSRSSLSPLIHGRRPVSYTHLDVYKRQDLPLEVIEKINIGIIPLRYTIDGVEHVDDRKDDSIFVDFYDKMKKGAMTSTSQPTPEELNELFTGSAEAGEGIIYIALSSAISGSYNTACMMMQACKEKYPDAQIAVVAVSYTHLAQSNC